jgi:hemerythrin-like domain-containing protein
MAETNAPNVAVDLLRIHSIITRGLNVATEKSQRFAQEGFPDTSTGEGFICYARSLASVLDAHHLTEEELVFPDMQGMLPDVPYDLLKAQHREITSVLGEIQAAIEEVAADPSVAAPLTKLHEALKRLGDLWHAHIGIEQDHFTVDKIATLIGPEEQVRLIRRYAEHGQKHAGPDYLVVPFLLYNLPPEERAIFARALPAIVTQQLVPGPWKEKWQPMLPFLLS